MEDINGVFEESNTYQPSVPSTEAEIILAQNIHKPVTDGLEVDFIIDQTLGRDVKFTIDDLPGSGSITDVQLLKSDGAVLYDFGPVNKATMSKTFSQLEVSFEVSKASN